MVLALDTSILGFFLVASPKAGQEALAAASRGLVGGDRRLLIPTPALAESLSWVPKERREAAERALLQLPGVSVVSFDQRAAVTAAGLGSVKLKDRSHQKIKVDLQIFACALRYGAEGLCTADDDLVRVAGAAEVTLRVGPPTLFVPQLPLVM